MDCALEVHALGFSLLWVGEGVQRVENTVLEGTRCLSWNLLKYYLQILGLRIGMRK